MKPFRILILILGLFVCGSAQSNEKLFVLSGTIYDPIKAAIPESEITLEDHTGRVFKTLSDEEGTYRISIPFGKYTIEFRRSGFRLLRVINFENTSLIKKTLDADLEVRFCDDCNGDMMPGVNNEEHRKPVVIDFSKPQVKANPPLFGRDMLDKQPAAAGGGRHKRQKEAARSYIFGRLERSDTIRVKKLFDKLDRVLVKEPGSRAFIINYGADEEAGAREKQIRKFISISRENHKIVFARGPKSGRLKTVFWVVPAGADGPPQQP